MILKFKNVKIVMETNVAPEIELYDTEGTVFNKNGNPEPNKSKSFVTYRLNNVVNGQTIRIVASNWENASAYIGIAGYSSDTELSSATLVKNIPYTFENYKPLDGVITLDFGSNVKTILMTVNVYVKDSIQVTFPS